jgi:hypothetical protein
LEKKGVDEMPTMQEFEEGRKNEDAYMIFFDHFLPCVVRKTVFEERLKESIGEEELCTVSDEAFALVLLENSYDRWVDIFKKGNHKAKSEYRSFVEGDVQKKTWVSDVPTKYTRGGLVLTEKAKLDLEKHDKAEVEKHPDKKEIVLKGWTQFGVDRYNVLFKHVEKDREDNQEFVAGFVAQVHQKRDGSKASRKRKKDDAGVCGFHELGELNASSYGWSMPGLVKHHRSTGRSIMSSEMDKESEEEDFGEARLEYSQRAEI